MASQNTFTGTQQSAYFPALTGVRAVAAFLVFVHHMRPPEGILPDFLQLYLTAGHIGVTVFFVLSGFLIAYRYEEALNDQTISFGTYFLRRVTRIYPLYLLLTVLVLIWQGNNSVWHWFLNISLLKGFFDDEKFTGIAQSWSLTVEESFYLLAPLLFILFRKHGLLAVLLILLVGAGVIFFSQVLELQSFMANLNFMAEFTVFGRIFEFYCGYRLAKLFKNQATGQSTNSYFTILGSAFAFAAYSAIGLAHYSGNTLNWFVKPEILINNAVLPLAIMVLFFGLLTEKNWLTSILGSGLFQILGKSSYAFYLIHAGVFYQFIYANITTNKIFTFLLLNLAAMAIFYLFEEPVNRYLRRKTDVWRLKKNLDQREFFQPKA